MNSHQRAAKGAEVVRYVRAIKRRAHLLLLPVIFVPCAAIIGLSVVAPVYESSSIVLYEERLPFAREMDRMIVQKPESRVRDRQRLAQIGTRLKGRLFLQEVIEGLRMELGARSVEKLEAIRKPEVNIEELKTRVIVEALRKMIEIQEIGPDLFKITFVHSDGNMAYVLADGITRLFVEFMTKGQLANIRAAGTFSEDQLPVYEEKLRQSEERLRRSKAQMAGRSMGGGAVDEENMGTARSLIRQVEMEIDELEENGSTARETMRRNYPNAVDPTTLIRSNAINTAYSQVAKEEELCVPLLIEGESRTSVMEKVGQARERLLAGIEEAVRRTLQGSPEVLQSLVIEAVYTDYIVRSLETRRSSISGLVAQYSRSVARKPQDEMELKRLEEEVENNRSVLQSFRHQLTSTRISEAAQTTDLGVRIEIVEPPARPLLPVGPGKQRILLLAFVLGSFLGISFVIMSEYMDDSVKTVEDVAKNLGVTVLGTIPRMPGVGFWQPIGKRRWPYIVALAAVILATIVHLANEPLLEALGRGRTEIEAASSYNPAERIPGENEARKIVDQQ